MNQLPDDVKALLERGDPAHEVDARIAARVAGRLSEARPRASWRPVVLVIVGLAGAALGSGLTFAVTKWMRAPAPIPVVVPSVPMAPARDPLTEEAALLQSALEALQQGDASAALRHLDERDAAFPHGVLVTEAGVARIRALVARGDAASALMLLERLPAHDVTPGLRVLWLRTLVSERQCDRARDVAALIPPESSELVKSLLDACVKGTGP